MDSWYVGSGVGKMHYHPAPIPAGFQFATVESKREFVEKIVNNHLKVNGIAFDQNYLPTGSTYPKVPEKYEKLEHFMDGFIAASAPGVSFFRHVNNHNANVAWVRIKNIPDKEDQVISVVIDRWHDNVRFLIREGKTLDPSKDRADFISGFIGSYPNYFLEVDVKNLPDFFDILDNYDGSEIFIARLNKYGVNRADKRFWEVYDWFQEEFLKNTGEHPGLIDLNRYFYLADE